MTKKSYNKQKQKTNRASQEKKQGYCKLCGSIVSTFDLPWHISLIHPVEYQEYMKKVWLA